MSNKCKECQYGPTYDPCSDMCDACMSDSDTGWGGFTDHRADRHFYSEEEQTEYYDKCYYGESEHECSDDDDYDPA